MFILWAVLSLLSLSAAQCSEKKNEGNVFEDLSFFQEDESMIQDENTESDLQFYEGNEELESTNINLHLAKEMLGEDMSPENDGQIQAGEYVNHFTWAVAFECGDGQGLFAVQSEYSAKFEDRRWNFACKSISKKKLKWTACSRGYTTNTKSVELKHFHIRCPKNYFITGILSVFSLFYKDRVWFFDCCTISSVSVKPIYPKEDDIMINKFGENIDYTAPENAVIIQIRSRHITHKDCIKMNRDKIGT